MTHRTASRQQIRLAYDARQQMDGAVLMKALPARSVMLAVYDPQYRGVLDHMKYGNEGKQREMRRAALPHQSEYQIAMFIQHIERVLKPGAHLLLWCSKYMIAKGRHMAVAAYVEGEMTQVEMIHWNTLKMGMGPRCRGASEYCVVMQKKPYSAKLWKSDRSIRDTWPESSDRSDHPHRKPHVLTERLVRMLTKQGDTVLDPCAGSYSTLDVCQLTRRRFIGCDISSPV